MGDKSQKREKDLPQIKLEPSVLKFIDIEKNKVYETTLKVTNTGQNRKWFKLQGPLTKNFALEVKNPSSPQACGLGFTAKVTFSTNKVDDYADRLILLCDSDVIKIPIFAYAPTAVLQVQPMVDFGLVVANSHFLSKEMRLINLGSKAAPLGITYKGNKQIQITPQTGMLCPNKALNAEVKLFTGTPGIIREKVEVHLEGAAQDMEVIITANIVEQAIKVMRYEDVRQEQNCVNFGPVYYGTDRIEPAWVFNDSPEPVKWITILDEGCPGEEAGTNLTLTTAAIMATEGTQAMRGKAYDVLTSLVTVYPNQGILNPYQRVPIYFRFSPRFNVPTIGWESKEEPPPRQDFALFISFEIVGSKNSFTDRAGGVKRRFEVGITATALPVLLKINPMNKFDFGELACSEQASTRCTLYNESAILPLDLKFRKVSQFNVFPKTARIKPGHSKEFVISFQPNQAGEFRKVQLIEALGRVFRNADDEGNEAGEAVFAYMCFQTIPVQLLGKSLLDPAWLNAKVSENVKKMKMKQRDGINIASVNDRPTSIRPANHQLLPVETPLTRQPRHTYVDRDFAFTRKEERQKVANDNKYVALIRRAYAERMRKLANAEHLRYDDRVNIGLKPGKGLAPLKLRLGDVEKQQAIDNIKKPPIRGDRRLLNTKDLAGEEENARAKPVIEGLNAIPITKQEKIDCSRQLTPKELFNVVVGPPLVDFGEVCTRSSTRKEISILNNLNQYISFEINVKFKELRQTSPLAQIIPPKSQAKLPLVFESTCKGQFDRSLKYTINSHHKSHLLVKALVVPVQLRLSTELLEVYPEPGAPVDAAFRSTVTLYNDRNYPAEFTWSPVLGERGTAFTIRPACGVVNSFRSLKCEVVFHQSYNAPLDGEFLLKVLEGKRLKLVCLARLGTSPVQFLEKKLSFGNVPLNLSTKKTTTIVNNGPNNAMFAVANCTPIENMQVYPPHGIIPTGGSAELTIVYEPTSLGKYEAFIDVLIRGWKSLELRFNGIVEEPKVDINLPEFKYHGVYCGSWQTISFKMVNKGQTAVRVELDMSRYEDFTFAYESEDSDEESSDDKKRKGEEKEESGRFHCFEIGARATLPCTLKFHPTSVAGYDFVLPFVMNKTPALSPSPSLMPVELSESLEKTSTKRKNSLVPQTHVVTPKRRVQATALRQPLLLSETNFKFSLPVSYMEMSVPDNAGGDRKVIVLKNQSETPVPWKLGMSTVKGLMSKDTAFVFLKQGGADYGHNKVRGVVGAGETYKLTVVFCPRKVGSYVAEIPFYINDDTTKPYRTITLDASMVQSAIKFEPSILSLSPVPLSNASTGTFHIVATGFFKSTGLRWRMEKPKNEHEDCDYSKYFQVTFPNGLQINPAPTNSKEVTRNTLMASVRFCSKVPISKSLNLVFTDDMDREHTMMVTATADNCLLTTYPFLALHRREYKIVCDEQADNNADNNYDAEDSDDELNGTGAVKAVQLQLNGESERMSQMSRNVSSTTTSRFNASSSSFISSTEPDNTDNADEKLKRLYIVKDDKKNEGGIIKEGSVCFPTEVLASDPDFDYAKVESSAEDSAETESNLSSARPKTGESRLTVTHSERSDLRVSSSKLERVASCIFPPNHRPDSAFYSEVVTTLQSWYSLFGWTSPFALTVPDKIRDVISKFTFKTDDSGEKAPSSTLTNPKTLYDMVMNLSGRALPGITLSQPLPFNIRERVKQLHWQHATLLTFVRSQGGAVSSIRPEYLMSPVDYRAWYRFKMELSTDGGGGKTSVKLQDESTKSGAGSGAQAAGSDTSVSTCNESLAPRGDRSEVMLSGAVFELVSKRAWTDLLLQIYKVFVLSRVTYEQHAAMRSPHRSHPFPAINASTQASNIYSVSERIVLSWLNHNYEHTRASSSLWGGAPPPSRWVVNFDLDLLDGLVLISTLAAYCPWLGEECFSDVYTSPSTPEQCLHNTLLVVKALKSIGLNYHIQATDITDPNPITMLFLVVFLYQHLPAYLPKTKIEFVGGLTQSVKRKVIVQNPGGKPVKYTCKIFGRDGADFTVASGRDLHVVSRGNSSVEVVFKSRLLRPAEAYLVLTSRYEFPMNGEQDHKTDLAVGSTIVFELQTIVNHIEPVRIVEAQSPCYELTRVQVPVSNPYNKSAEFTIVITEPKLNQPDPSDLSGAASGKKSDRKSAGNDADRLSGLLSPDVRSRLNSYASYSGEESTGAGDGAMAQSEMASFYCRQRSVWLEPQGRATVVVSYLPLNMGKHFCTVLLVNEQVGELVYAVEGEAGLPLPSPLRLNLNSPHSADMDEETKRNRNWQENVLYWKCPVNSTLYERLHIPVTNPSKERALRLAAQQHMSGEERRRRSLTGTHQSGTLAASIAMRSRREQEETGGGGAYRSVFFKAPQARYKVQTSNNAFEVPSTVLAPTPLATGPTPATEMRAKNIKPNSIQPDGTFGLDLKFTSEGAGLYASEIFLRSASDVRLYRIECVVHPSGTRASIDFSTPANQALTQNIPIQNSSNHDWFLECKITGKNFSGPGGIAVKAQETAQYPLTFHPNCECVVDGTLKISNKADGLEHNIELHGVGETSLAVETIKIRCKCRSTLTRTITVPNFSRGTLNYGVYSDLAFLDGASSLLVPRHKSAEYAFTLAPQQRGTMRGVLMFVADDVECDPPEPDSDDDEPPPRDDDSESEKIRAETPSFKRPTGGSEDKVDGQKVWFGIQVEVEPSDPISTFEVECSAHGTRTVTIPIDNPTGDEINCTVQIMGEYLTTQETIRLLPKMPGQLPITFAPLCVGTFEGSVVFDSPTTGEFWYKLVARATTPAPVALRTMDSALGGISRQAITLRNMLDEVMVVEVDVDNKANFTFDLPTNDETGLQEVKVRPNAQLDVLLQFNPTQPGLHTHKAKIEFTSTQLGTQVYHASGRGLAPTLMEPMSISAGIGATTSLTLPFRNPTDVGVLLDIRLTENDETLGKVSKSFIRRSVTSEPGFALVEKHTSNVRVAPHESLDIMFSFSPRKMMKYLASMSLSIKRQDGQAWPEEYESREERSKNESELALGSMGRDGEGRVRTIRWLYPIHGIPVLPPTSSSSGGEEEAVLECQARSRMEERLEVSLTGAVPSVGARKSLIRLLGARGADRNSSGGQIIDGLTLNEEFHFEFFYASERSKNQVERSLSVELIGKDRDPSSGIVILTFKLLFSPYFTMNEVSQLSVTSINGGSWSFPLRIRATEPPPDDRITIVATTVGEASVVSFKLNSQAGHPTPFDAYFTGDSDKEFEISPRSGELQPDGSEGTLLTIAFTPSSYGRKYRGLLVVKATDMQWSYAVRGKFPKYEPPKVKSRVDLGPLKLKRGDPKQSGEEGDERKKKCSNFMQRNIRLLTTAASSPIKGRPING